MPYYESIWIARQDISTQQVEELAGQLGQILSDQGGQVASQEYWGLKNLAYRIKKNRKGHYLLLNLDAPSPAIVEMERQLGLNEDERIAGLIHIGTRGDTPPERPRPDIEAKTSWLE